MKTRKSDTPSLHAGCSMSQTAARSLEAATESMRTDLFVKVASRKVSVDPSPRVPGQVSVNTSLGRVKFSGPAAYEA